MGKVLNAGNVSNGVVPQIEETERRKRGHIGHVFNVVACEISMK